MSDLKMKINTDNNLRLKMKSNQFLKMTIDDFQRFQEEDPIFKDSPAYSITYQDITNWNDKSNFSGNYNDLYNKPNLGIYATINFVNGSLSNKVDKVEGMGLSQNSFTTEEKNKLAELENYDDTEILNELAEKADISDIPTEVSELINDSGYITKDVDDLTNYPTNSAVDAAIGGKQNIIDSNNMLSSDLVDDTNHTNKFVTTSDITTWNNKSDFSGDYNDLTNKPTIPTLTSQLTNDSGFITNANIPTKTSDLQNDSGFITNTVNDLTNYTLSSALATVATSGSYSDLSNTPTIPTATSDLNNDSGFITNSVNNLTNYTLTSALSTVAISGSYNDLSNKPTIPTKTSELTNDSGFVTNTYSTSETVCGTWIDGKTLYRKVYKFTNLSSNYTIDSFNEITSISGMLHRKDYDIYIPVNGRQNDTGWATSFGNIQGTGLAFIYGNSWNSSTFDKLTVIIEYTKSSS